MLQFSLTLYSGLPRHCVHSIVIANIAKKNQNSKVQSLPAQINSILKRMSTTSAIGSRLIRDCAAIVKPACVGPGSRHVSKYCDM